MLYIECLLHLLWDRHCNIRVTDRFLLETHKYYEVYKKAEKVTELPLYNTANQKYRFISKK